MTAYIDIARTDTSFIAVSGANSHIATMLFNGYYSVIGAIGHNSGKKYFEAKLTSIPGGGGNNFGGLGDAAFLGSQRPGYSSLSHGLLGSLARYYHNSVLVGNPTGNPLTLSGSFSNVNESVAVAVDLDTGRCWIGATNAGNTAINWGFIGSATSDPATNTDPLFTDTDMIGVTMYPIVHVYYADSVYELKLAADDFDFAVPAGFEPWFVVPTVTVGTFLSQPYGLTFDYNLSAACEQAYVISSDLYADLKQLYSMTLEVWLTQYYGDVRTLNLSSVQPYSSPADLSVFNLQRWGHSTELETILEQPWTPPDVLHVDSVQRYGIVSEVLHKTSEQLYHINENSTLFADVVQPYALAAEAAQLYYFDTKLFANGERIPFHALEWQASDAESVWSCEFSMKSLAAALKCQPGVELVITHAGETWTLKNYDGWFEDRRHGSVVYRSSGFSRTHDLNQAEPLTGELPDGMASQLVADIAAPYGITVEWQMADGYLAAGLLDVSGMTPMEAIKEIVHDAYGLVMSTLDGNLLIVAEEEIPVPEYEATTPAETIIARVERITTSSQPDTQRGYNRLIVSDQTAAAGGFYWDDIKVDGFTREVRLWVTPLDPDRTFRLDHSGGVAVTIEPFGITELLIENEQVEFVAGASKTTKPVHGITASTWGEADLGDITAQENGFLSSTVAGESLAKISYITKYLRWIVRDQKVNDVQFIFHEV